jgi:hypothetical protein
VSFSAFSSFHQKLAFEKLAFQHSKASFSKPRLFQLLAFPAQKSAKASSKGT